MDKVHYTHKKNKCDRAADIVQTESKILTKKLYKNLTNKISIPQHWLLPTEIQLHFEYCYEIVIT